MKGSDEEDKKLVFCLYRWGLHSLDPEERKRRSFPSGARRRKFKHKLTD